jgi:hypothetical protein
MEPMAIKMLQESPELKKNLKKARNDTVSLKKPKCYIGWFLQQNKIL